jgi:hypothetical protein
LQNNLKKKTPDFRLIFQFFIKTFFSDKAVYTPTIASNLDIFWTNLPINKEQTPPLNSAELRVGYSTKLLLDFYSLPNLFVLTFYSKSFYIFMPATKILNIFNLFTWLNFNKKYINKTPLKDFLPLFLFPKLKTAAKKKKYFMGRVYIDVLTKIHTPLIF